MQILYKMNYKKEQLPHVVYYYELLRIIISSVKKSANLQGRFSESSWSGKMKTGTKYFIYLGKSQKNFTAHPSYTESEAEMAEMMYNLKVLRELLNKGATHNSCCYRSLVKPILSVLLTELFN